MTVSRRIVMMDQDVSSLVVSHGKIEEVKSTLFSTSQLFMAEYQFQMDNSLKIFSQGSPKSILNGYYYNSPMTVYRNDKPVFEGFIKSVDPDPVSRVATITATNVLGLAADKNVVLEDEAVNPAIAILSALTLAGLEAFVDRNSFFAAAGQFTAAGAVITLNYDNTNSVSGLDAANAIADLCSLSLVTRGTKIYCEIFKPYPGNNSGLGPTITGNYVKTFGEMKNNDAGYVNTVEMVYGAALKVTVSDQVRARADGRTRSKTYTADSNSDITIPDRASALFLGQLALARSGYIRRELPVLLGKEFESIITGDRHAITEPKLGLVEEPFEAVEVRKMETTDDIETMFVSLR